MDNNNLTYNVKRNNRNLMLAFVIIVAVIVLVIVIGFFILKPRQEIIQGQVEGDETRISGKLMGRVAQFFVREGDTVMAGDTLVAIFSADAEAKLQQVEAMKQAAEAQNKKVDAGTRQQLIQSAYQMWKKSEAGLYIARKSYQRIDTLFSKGVTTAQKRDEAQANYEAMIATEKAARAQYDLALAGAQSEDKQMSAANVEQANAGVEQVEAVLADAHLTSPINGQISEIYPRYGELVGAGAPIMSVLDMKNLWVAFNVREDMLDVLRMGDTLELIIPALNNKEVTMKIYLIKDLGTYAIWRATKTIGQYDAKTFEVRCRPENPVEGLRPGMTVLFKRKL